MQNGLVTFVWDFLRGRLFAEKGMSHPNENLWRLHGFESGFCFFDSELGLFLILLLLQTGKVSQRSQ
jgi:hypothetical protein